MLSLTVGKDSRMNEETRMNQMNESNRNERINQSPIPTYLESQFGFARLLITSRGGLPTWDQAPGTPQNFIVAPFFFQNLFECLPMLSQAVMQSTHDAISRLQIGLITQQLASFNQSL